MSAGVEILTVGGASRRIIIETLSETVFPPESVTDAVIVCVPRLNGTSLKGGPPIPKNPSMSELQEIDGCKGPSSGSTEVPVKLTSVPIT